MLLGALLSVHKAKSHVHAPSARARLLTASPSGTPAHLAISTHNHLITNQTELGFPNQLTLPTTPLCKQYKQSPNAPKDKGRRICFNSSHLSLPFIKSVREPRCFFSQNVSTFPLCLLIPANSILLQGFIAFCLYYRKQILSCPPASESSYTLLQE